MVQAGPVYTVQFTPVEVGQHTVDVRYGGQRVTGSPYICDVYDADLVHVVDATQEGIVGCPAGFVGGCLWQMGWH